MAGVLTAGTLRAEMRETVEESPLEDLWLQGTSGARHSGGAHWTSPGLQYTLFPLLYH